MAEAKADHDWTQTATMLALTANCHRDPKKGKSFTMADFHPIRRRKKKEERLPGSIMDLKKIFVDRKAT